jgi:hypothetical protein
MSESELTYPNSPGMVPAAPDMTKPGETKSDVTLLDGEQQKPEPNPMGTPPQNVKPGFIESTPQAVREARGTAEHNPYLATQLDEAGKHVSSIADGADADPLNTEALQVHADNVRELSTIVLTDFGGSTNDAQLLAAETRRFSDFTPEQHEEAKENALTQFKGARPDTWPQDLKLVRDFIARDPRVVQYLSSSGVGNSLPLALRILELARASLIKGPSKK